MPDEESKESNAQDLDVEKAAATYEGTAEEQKDFKFALKELLTAYRPILEEDLGRTRAPVKLAKEAEEQPPRCEDEIELATRIFAKFFSDEVAVRTLPAKARELLGPKDRWRWCLRHIRCCIILGWLICRRPLTYRALLYYLRWFWFCVRRSAGAPVDEKKLTAQDREDFAVLVKAFTSAYQPYLSDQLAAVESPFGLPDAVLDGEVDCLEGADATVAIFERTLTPEAQQALLGRERFAEVSQQPWFWFCRCWCLCAIRFGCCLARIHSIKDVVYCLRRFLRCLRHCFGPPICELTDPAGCVAEEANTALSAMVVPVMGTAAGGGFQHYVLEWSDGGPWQASDFHYPPIPPGGGAQGNFPVFGGLLAYFDTTAKDAGFYQIRMTVHSTLGAAPRCGTRFFLFKQDVRILGISNHFNLDASEFDPAAKLVENVPALCARPAGVHEVSFGRSISVQGSAFVGGCWDKKIKRYRLDYKPGFEIDCTSGGWTNFWNVDYNTIWQYRSMNMRTDTDNLTSRWVNECVVPNPTPPPFCSVSVVDARLAPSSWPTHVHLPCAASGLYTFRLVVEDTAGVEYCDTQRVWIDNHEVCAVIRIDAVPPCTDLLISPFATPPDCSNPWPLPLSGIAWDDYIDDSLPLTRPNDNFDYYTIKVTKQGGASVDIPIDAPDGSCFYGTSRVGNPNPGVPCDPCDPANMSPAAVYGTLAEFDLRAVDPLCSSSASYPVPAAFTVPRGECCVFIFELWVYDRTKFSGGPHRKQALWPVKICNDLQPT